MKSFVINAKGGKDLLAQLRAIIELEAQNAKTKPKPVQQTDKPRQS